MTADRLPYPGLRAFTREESDLFFGREGCVDAMVDRFAATRFLAVLGPSGSGKSSLVRTGFQDALDLGLHPWAGSRWKIADMHPGSQPMHSLALALLRARDSQEPEEIDVQLLTEYLEFGPRSVLEWAAGGNLEPGTNLLLMVDQFEELFRYGDYAQRETAEAFVALLLENAAAPDMAVHVVITMRSEFLGACALIAGLAERINVGLYLTPRMGREECREAIEGPASVLGFTVERALVNRLLNDLGSFAPWETGEIAEQAEKLSRQADQLPVMQHVLNRLYVRALNGPSSAEGLELKLADYERIGGLSGALDAHGAEVIDRLEKRLGKECLPQIEMIFRALVSGTSIALAVRRPSRLKELVELAGGEQEMLISIVEAFRATGCNFLRTSQHSLHSTDVIVDISHESLIRQWSALRGWLVEEWRDRAAWDRLISAEEHYRNREGDLLKGLDLQNLSDWWDVAMPTSLWATRHGGHYDLAKDFLEKSREAEIARERTELRRVASERNRLRVYVVGMAVVLVFLTLFAVEARLATIKAKDAEQVAEQARGRMQTAVSVAKREKERADTTAGAALASAKSEMAAKIAAQQSAQAATENAQKSARFLENLSDVLYTDASGDRIGTRELKSQLMDRFLEYQKDLSNRDANAFRPEARVTNGFRQALSYQAAGNAVKAIDSYKAAYEDGLRSVQTRSHDPHQDQALMAVFLQDASSYAWYLLDIGETEAGSRVLAETRRVLAAHGAKHEDAAFLIADAKFENLQSRYSLDLHQPQERESHARRAVAMDRQAVAVGDPALQLRAQAAAVAAIKNLVLLAKEPELSRLESEVCDLANSMHKAAPQNTGTLRAEVICLDYRASKTYNQKTLDSALEKKNLDTAIEETREAVNKIDAALTVDPDDPTMLLLAASHENALGDYLQARDDKQKKVEQNDLANGRSQAPNGEADRLKFVAAGHFVAAVKDRTPLQEDSEQFRRIFDACTRAGFPNQKEELQFYVQIVEAITSLLQAFPKAHELTYIAGVSSEKIGIILSKDKARERDAEKYLTQSVNWFDQSGIIQNLDTYSVDFAQYCYAIEQRADFYAGHHNPGGMQSDLAKLRSACTPVLHKYPWDYYVRMHLIEADAIEGRALHAENRFVEARPFLERASYWGMSESSRLLAEEFRKGLGVQTDPVKAEALDGLAVQQVPVTFTMAVYYGPTEQDVVFYLRQWPAEFARQYPGISDQVKLYREARQATINQRQIDAISKLQEIALRNHDSFPGLCLMREFYEPAKKRYEGLMAAGSLAEAAPVMQELVDAADQLLVARANNQNIYYAWQIYLLKAESLQQSEKQAARSAFLRSADIARMFPDGQPSLLLAIVASYYELGVFDRTNASETGAAAAFADAVKAAQKAFALSTDASYHLTLRSAMLAWMGSLRALKREEEANAARSVLLSSAGALTAKTNIVAAQLEAILTLKDVAIDEPRTGDKIMAQQHLDRARKMALELPNTVEGTFAQSSAWGSLASAFLTLNSVPDAREAYRQAALSKERYITFRVATPPQKVDGDGSDLKSLYGSLSYTEVEAGRFKEAIQAAEAALRLKPDEYWIEANMAHGLLFLGKYEEARKHYMNARGGRVNGITIPEATKEDFIELRKLGISDSRTDAILMQMRQP